MGSRQIRLRRSDLAIIPVKPGDCLGGWPNRHAFYHFLREKTIQGERHWTACTIRYLTVAWLDPDDFLGKCRHYRLSKNLLCHHSGNVSPFHPNGCSWRSVANLDVRPFALADCTHSFALFGYARQRPVFLARLLEYLAVERPCLHEPLPIHHYSNLLRLRRRLQPEVSYKRLCLAPWQQLGRRPLHSSCSRSFMGLAGTKRCVRP